MSQEEKKKWLKQNIIIPFVNHFELYGHIIVQVENNHTFDLILQNTDQINIAELPTVLTMYQQKFFVNVTVAPDRINKSLEKFEFEIEKPSNDELIIGVGEPINEFKAKERFIYTNAFDNFKHVADKFVRLEDCLFTKAVILSVSAETIIAKNTGKEWRKASFVLQDDTNQVVQAERFNLSVKDFEKVKTLKKKDVVIVGGAWKYNDFQECEMINVNHLTRLASGQDILAKNDLSGQAGRFDLNVTTKMSAMASINDAHDLVDKASEYGLNGVAVTDINSVQGVNDIEQIGKTKKNFNTILGCELDVLNDLEFKPFLGKKFNGSILEFLRDNEFYVFDTETTGTSTVEDKIVQMSSLKMVKGQEQEFFDELANPNREMSQYLRNLTHLENEDLTQYRPSDEVVLDWYENFVDYKHPQNKVLVAHNAKFDLSMIDVILEKHGLPKIEDTFTVVDTLYLSRFILRNRRSHRLGDLATSFNLPLDAHNALNDARATAVVMFYLFLLVCFKTPTVENLEKINFDENSNFFGDTDKLCKFLNKVISSKTFSNNLLKTKLGYENDENFQIDFEKNTIYDLEQLLSDSFKCEDENGLIHYPFGFANSISILPKDIQGRKILYQLLSKAHTVRFYRSPRIWLSDLLSLTPEERSHILIGSGNIKSEFQDVLERLGKRGAELLVKLFNYDYIEVLPPTSASFDENNDDRIVLEDKVNKVQRMLQEIKQIEQETGIPVVVVSESHYTLEKDALAFEILGKEYKKSIRPQYLRTAKELMKELIDYGLDEQTAHNWVYENTMRVANQVEMNMPPTASKLNPPLMPHAKEELKELTLKGLKKYYGDNPPQMIVDRMNTELKMLLDNGYETVYLTAHKLVKKANENGYLVGSRGSVGSSLVALFCGITEINALPPHYRSINGNYTEFVDPKKYNSGFDLPPKKNPIDGTDLIGDGHNIPFETFLGTDGTKIPDIDLNFDSSWQAQGQEYMKELFGADHVIRVGTISSLAEKNSYGAVISFQNQNGKSFTKAQTQYLADKIVNSKKTTGQHPAGILVVPRDKDIEDFTPKQNPANKADSEWHTSHLPMTTMHDCLLKMDILGHDNPLILRKLREMTGVDPHVIKPNDEQVLSLFTSNKELNLPDDKPIFRQTGAVGLPEFGTDFVLQMLQDTQPHTFSDLVQISGLSHGTNVWLGNAKDLIDNHTATLKDVIGTRDKLMTDMLNHGLSHAEANEITLAVKKKKPIRPELLDKMRQQGVPEWYIESAQKIKYMFPAGHAVSYTQDSFRIGWYKIHYPWEFYTTYMSFRKGDVGLAPIKYKIDTLYKYIDKREHEEKIQHDVLESQNQRKLIVMYEAKLRGIKFAKPHINSSDAIEWTLTKDENGNYKEIVAPLTSVKGLGEKKAKLMIERRNKLPNKKCETLEQAKKVIHDKSMINALTRCGGLKGLE